MESDCHLLILRLKLSSYWNSVSTQIGLEIAENHKLSHEPLSYLCILDNLSNKQIVLSLTSPGPFNIKAGDGQPYSPCGSLQV